MVNGHARKKVERNSPPCVFLEISGQEGTESFQVPVIIRSISGGVVTLEIRDLWFRMDSETLNGRATCLRLETAGNDGSTNIEGTVNWTKFTGGGKGRLSLGMKLANPGLMADKVLEDLIPHTPTDLKKLWEHWDQAKIGQVTACRTGKIHSALLGLALGVIIFKLVEPKSFNTLTDLIISMCGLVGTIEAIRILRKKTASS